MMTSEEAIAKPGNVGRAIRTPRGAAAAGIVFSLLFSAVLVLVRTVIVADPEEAERWPPAWVLTLSVYILVTGFRQEPQST